MGRWWSPTPSSHGNPANEEQSTTSLHKEAPQKQAAATAAQHGSNKRLKLTRDEQADAEFHELLASLGSEGGEDKTNRSSQRRKDDAKRQESRSQSTTATLSTISTNAQSPPEGPQPNANPKSNDESGPKSVAPESLYSDSMSCRSAFDYAFFCQSFGGQWVNVYRYGELRSCSDQWHEFWLCMKSRAYPDEERKRIIRDHYREKAIKYKVGPSSEDVWEVRTEPVHDAFRGDFAALEKQLKEEAEQQERWSGE